MRALRLCLVALAAATGGAALGAAFLLVPSILFGTPRDLWFLGGAAFIVSLPFTLAGTAMLTGLSLLSGNSLSRRLFDYVGLILIGVAAGALMPVPLFGAAGIFFGAIFAAFTATLWAILHGRFAVADEVRESGHG